MDPHFDGPYFDGRDFAAVLFDMDGTLIDSTPAVVRSWAAWAQEYGLTAEQLAGNHGVPAAAIIAGLLPVDQRVGALERINEIELADVGDVVPLPGSIETLKALADVPHAIVTSATRALAQARLAASGLTSPDVVVSADEVRHGKPAPDPYLLAAEQLGVDPADCLVVEDAPKGLQAGKAAGATTLAVVSTTPPDELDADQVVPNLAAVAWQVHGHRVRVFPAR